MARWFGDDDKNIPDRLKGKTPEAIAAELADLEAKKTKAEQDAANAAALQTELENTKGEFATVKARLQQLEAGGGGKPNGEGAGNGEGKQHEIPSVSEDEEGAFNARLQPLFVQNLMIAASMERQQTLNQMQMSGDLEDKLVIKQYLAEIDVQFMNHVPLQGRAMPGTYANCVAVVRDKHRREIREALAKEQTNHVEPGTSGTGPAAEQKKGEMTEEQIRVAKRMGVDPAKYAERAKGMVYGPAI